MAKPYSLKPGKTTTEALAPERFVQSAEDSSGFPWDDPMVRADVVKLVSLRLSEPDYLKLKFLSEKTHISQQELLKNVILPWLAGEIAKL